MDLMSLDELNEIENQSIDTFLVDKIIKSKEKSFLEILERQVIETVNETLDKHEYIKEYKTVVDQGSVILRTRYALFGAATMMSGKDSWTTKITLIRTNERIFIAKWNEQQGYVSQRLIEGYKEMNLYDIKAGKYLEFVWNKNDIEVLKIENGQLENVLEMLDNPKISKVKRKNPAQIKGIKILIIIATILTILKLIEVINL